MVNCPLDCLVSIRGLKTYFYLDEGVVRAVDGVDLDIPKGKTLCVVGESGCGKSITSLSILGMIQPPGKVLEGEITLNLDEGPVTLTDLKPNSRQFRNIRGYEIAMIFQEPMSSLSPVHTVGDQIMEAILLHTKLAKSEARARTIKAMEHVGIPDPDRRFSQYPHEMSGGLRQRIMIAMALSCRPKLLIADEPTTALDVTIQAQILYRLKQAKEDLNMSIMLITHNLGVVAEMADEVAVMYMGRIVEQAESKVIFADPQHPYTIGLMASIPGLGATRKSELRTIKGSVPDPFIHVPGCPFHPRCSEAVKGLCNVGEQPQLLEFSPGHKTACLVRQRAVSAEKGVANG